MIVFKTFFNIITVIAHENVWKKEGSISHCNQYDSERYFLAPDIFSEVNRIL